MVISRSSSLDIAVGNSVWHRWRTHAWRRFGRKACVRVLTSRGVGAAFVFVLLLTFQTTLANAQGMVRSAGVSDAQVASVFAFNALIGGATASLRAILGRRDPVRAFALGTLGGTVHFVGKLATSRASSFGVAGIAISSAGTAMVGNAGQGSRLFEEAFLPIGFVRFRVTPYARSRVHVSLNLYEAVVAGQSLLRTGLRLDWERSAAASTLVFSTKNRRLIVDGVAVDGVTAGSVIVISAFAEDAARTARHEVVHVQQNWFVQELVDRPVERQLRQKMPLARILPTWLEVGILSPALLGLDKALFGNWSLVRQLRENEAEILERR